MGKRKKKKAKLRSSKGSSSIPKGSASDESGSKKDAKSEAKKAKRKGSAERSGSPTLESPFDRYVFGPVAPVRPYLLLRLTLLLLAFDCWVDLIPHAGRYGVGDFNVAHFGILEILPTPTPGIYIGTMVLCGWLAMVMAT